MKFKFPFPTNAGVAGKTRGGLGRTKTCRTCGKSGCRTGSRTCTGPREETLAGRAEDDDEVALATPLGELHNLGYTKLDVRVKRELIAEWLLSTKGDEVEVDGLDAGAPHPLPSVHLRLQSGVNPPPVCSGAEGVKQLEQKRRARWLKANAGIKGEKPAMKNLPAGVDWKLLANKNTSSSKGLSERFQEKNT